MKLEHGYGTCLKGIALSFGTPLDPARGPSGPVVASTETGTEREREKGEEIDRGDATLQLSERETERLPMS